MMMLATMSAKITSAVDPASGWPVYELASPGGATVVRLVPNAGANVISIRYKGRELLKTPPTIKESAGFMFGTPVLYPSPNRVRRSTFSFEGTSYSFPPNDGKNFLHGLVHSVPWSVVKQTDDADRTQVDLRLGFQPGDSIHETFPLKHIVFLAIQVGDDFVRWTYTVDAVQGTRNVPFGFALHPWFLYQGTRKNTFLTVPAGDVMEADGEHLPTGKLRSVENSLFDARTPKSLADFVIDDVYFGMKAHRPALIDFRDVGLKLELASSEDFTHLVVYTPEDKPWFCVENQTCSTDAHNLAAKGNNAAHLLVVEPGQSHTGWVEYRFREAKSP